MADTKISALTDGTPLQDGDLLPIVRSGANKKVSWHDHHLGTLDYFPATANPNDLFFFIGNDPTLVNFNGLWWWFDGKGWVKETWAQWDSDSSIITIDNTGHPTDGWFVHIYYGSGIDVYDLNSAHFIDIGGALNDSNGLNMGKFRGGDGDFVIQNWPGLSSIGINDGSSSTLTNFSLSSADFPALSNMSFKSFTTLTTFTIDSGIPLIQFLITGAALTQASVDAILVALSTNGINAGAVNLSGGTSAAPSAIGLAAKAVLVGHSWAVTTN